MKPTHFITDKGEIFEVKIVKTNKRSLIVDLVQAGKFVKQIKVGKKSKKLHYKKEN